MPEVVDRGLLGGALHAHAGHARRDDAALAHDRGAQRRARRGARGGPRGAPRRRGARGRGRGGGGAGAAPPSACARDARPASPSEIPSRASAAPRRERGAAEEGAAHAIPRCPATLTSGQGRGPQAVRSRYDRGDEARGRVDRGAARGDRSDRCSSREPSMRRLVAASLGAVLLLRGGAALGGDDAPAGEPVRIDLSAFQAAPAVVAAKQLYVPTDPAFADAWRNDGGRGVDDARRGGRGRVPGAAARRPRPVSRGRRGPRPAPRARRERCHVGQQGHRARARRLGRARRRGEAARKAVGWLETAFAPRLAVSATLDGPRGARGRAPPGRGLGEPPAAALDPRVDAAGRAPPRRGVRDPDRAGGRRQRARRRGPARGRGALPAVDAGRDRLDPRGLRGRGRPAGAHRRRPRRPPQRAGGELAGARRPAAQLGAPRA